MREVSNEGPQGKSPCLTCKQRNRKVFATCWDMNGKGAPSRAPDQCNCSGDFITHTIQHTPLYSLHQRRHTRRWRSMCRRTFWKSALYPSSAFFLELLDIRYDKQVSNFQKTSRSSWLSCKILFNQYNQPKMQKKLDFDLLSAHQLRNQSRSILSLGWLICHQLASWIAYLK